MATDDIAPLKSAGMTPSGTPIPTVLGVAGNLRSAAAEALLAGALLLSDVQRESSSWATSSQAKQSEERFRKALESLREALS